MMKMDFKQSKVSVLVFSVLLSFGVQAERLDDLALNQIANEYVFDELMFKGKTLNTDMLARLNSKDMIEPGLYFLSIYTNEQPSGRAEVPVYLDNNQSKVCLTKAILKRISLKYSVSDELKIVSLPKNDLHEALTCYDFMSLERTEVKINTIDQRLIINIPTKYLHQVPKGYIPLENLTVGDTMAFVNYYVNQYHRDYRGQVKSKNDSVFANFSTGINLGLWRLRHESNYSYSHASHGQTQDHWDNIRTYAKRALPALKSQLTVGQNYTTGLLLSGLPYTGIEIASDMRMLPTSMRDYAPTIRGVANTNAKVTVRQKDVIVYEKNVSPGTFEFRDIYSNYYKSDYDVTVEEADGVVRTFTVPYIAYAQLLRPGLSRYAFVVGKLRQDLPDNVYFVDGTYQLGLSNEVTLNSGMRLSRNYASVLLGGAYASRIGAISANLTTSYAKLDDDEKKTGWILDMDYSRTIYPTQTTLSIGGSLYSHSDYLNLTDFAYLRQEIEQYGAWYYRHPLKARLRTLLSQSIGDRSTVYLSYSTDLYRHTSEKSTQFQFGYNTTFESGLSFAASLLRQHSFAGGNVNDKSKETTLSLSLSMPIKAMMNAPHVSTTVTHSSDSGTYYQAGLNGQFGEHNRHHYNLNVSYDDAKYRQDKTTVSAGFQTQQDLLTLGINASKGNHYWQQSAFVRGAAVFHDGGVTFSPYVSDTFALIEAKGAEGAYIGGGVGGRINRDGYAIYPALIPYQYNTLYINTEGTKNSVDIIEGSYRVAPFDGMAVKVKFLTSQGYPLLITVKQNAVIPLGAVITNQEGRVMSMMGQANQVYLRAEHLQGRLTIAWGEEEYQSCEVDYDISEKDLSQPLIEIEQECLNVINQEGSQV